jgi:hypothetical protein
VIYFIPVFLLRVYVLRVLTSAGHQWLPPVILAIQEDHCWEPTWANSSGDPISKKKKKKSQKRADRVAQCVGPEFKPQHCKKKKKSVNFSPAWLAHSFNSSYLGGLQFQASPSKKNS